MRYPASEKLEIIRTIETSPLPVRRSLGQIGIPKSTFYAWLDRHATGGLEALEDRKSRPERVWNRIPDFASSRFAARRGFLSYCRTIFRKVSAAVKQLARL